MPSLYKHHCFQNRYNYQPCLLYRSVIGILTTCVSRLSIFLWRTKMNFPLLEAIAKELIWLTLFKHVWEKSYRLLIYLLDTSTTGFWTLIDCWEWIAVAVAAQVGAVPPVILTGIYWKSKQLNLKYYTGIILS